MSSYDTYFTFKTPDECLAAYCPQCGAMIHAIANSPSLKADIHRDITDWKLSGYYIQPVPRQLVIRELTRCHCRRGAK